MLHQSPRVLAAALPRLDPDIRDAVIRLFRAGRIAEAVRLAEGSLAALERADS